MPDQLRQNDADVCLFCKLQKGDIFRIAGSAFSPLIDGIVISSKMTEILSLLARKTSMPERDRKNDL